MANAAKHDWKFGRKSKAMEVIAGHNLEGKYAIVTGSNTGIGFETARALVSAKCHVVLACRDMQKAGAAVEKIKKEFPHGKAEAMKLDLGSFAEVKKFAEAYLHAKYPLHLLILNAGLMVEAFKQGVDGYEVTHHTNHLAQMYLTKLLESKLAASAPSRVVVLSSKAIEMTPANALTTDNLTEAFFIGNANGFNGLTVYGLSKCLNALYGQELSRRVKDKGISVFYVHPGLIHTNLQDNTDAGKNWLSNVPANYREQYEKTTEEGASTSIFCAVEKNLEAFSGHYFSDCQAAETPAWLTNDALIKHCWKLSEELIAKKTH